MKSTIVFFFLILSGIVQAQPVDLSRFDSASMNIDNDTSLVRYALQDTIRGDVADAFFVKDQVFYYSVRKNLLKVVETVVSMTTKSEVVLEERTTYYYADNVPLKVEYISPRQLKSAPTNYYFANGGVIVSGEDTFDLKDEIFSEAILLLTRFRKLSL